MENLLNTEEAAAWLKLTPNTLAKHRCRGTGPRFVRLGPGRHSPVRYRPRDLASWVSEATSTSGSSK